MPKSLIAAALTVAALAPATARDRTPPPATPTGPAVSCVPLNQLRESRVYGDNVIDFHTRGRQVYRNVLPHSCPSLGFEERFSYATSLNQLCSVDIITVIQSPGISRGASCGLGQFQPVKLLPKR